MQSLPKSAKRLTQQTNCRFDEETQADIRFTVQNTLPDGIDVDIRDGDADMRARIGELPHDVWQKPHRHHGSCRYVQARPSGRFRTLDRRSQTSQVLDDPLGHRKELTASVRERNGPRAAVEQTSAHLVFQILYQHAHA